MDDSATPTVDQILKSHYADSVLHTHVSMVGRKGKFQLPRQSLETFWKSYMNLIENEEDPLVGIAEKPQNYLPVLADIDIKIDEEFVPEELLTSGSLYTESHVLEVIKAYQSVIREIVENVKPEDLICVLLEKDPYYISGNWKHGFHLHFPYLFLSRADLEVHLIPRVRNIVTDAKIFEDIGIENSGSVIDEACVRNAWLLYGSKKSEEMQPYKVTKVYDKNCEVISLEKAFRQYQLYDEREELINIRNKVGHYLPRILSIIPFNRNVKELKRGLSSPLKTQIEQKTVQKKKNKISVEESLKIASKLIPMLAQFRAEDRNEWMVIGWALFNIGEGCAEALELWMDFSKRAEESYDEAVCINEWHKMTTRDITLGTLRYYASVDSPEEYRAFKQEQAEHYIKESLEGSHNDIAKVLYAMYGNEFVCASIVNNVWFQFRDHKWEEIEGGVDLSMRISEEVVQKYVAMGQEAYGKMANAEDKGQEAMFSERSKQARKMIHNLKSRPFKNNVMKECAEVFYDRRFRDKLDTNMSLLAFSNGVYDSQLKIFRPGRPEDFISRSLPIEYKDFDHGDEEVLAVKKYFEQVFPDKSVREYFLGMASDIIAGVNNKKVVLFWTGEGDNAKSVTQKIFEQMLGELAIKFNTTLLTGKKVGNGSANPELARAGRHVRWATLEEPDADEQLNIGLMKILSGGDTYLARDLFEKGKATKEVKPNFIMNFVCLDGNTKVTVYSGTSISLKNMSKLLPEVMSYDINTHGLTSVKNNKFLDKGEQNCITLTLMDGREITCTPDHRFLTSSQNSQCSAERECASGEFLEWVKAEDIQLNKDKLIMGFETPSVDDMVECESDYILEVGDFVYNMGRLEDRVKASAMCRIIGYMITDGSKNKFLNIGHPLDLEPVVRDVKLITGRNPRLTSMVNCTRVQLPNSLTKELIRVNSSDKKYILPRFMFDRECPVFLVREVLGAIFGRCGSINQFDCIQLPNESLSNFNEIKDLVWSVFGIECTIRSDDYDTRQTHFLISDIVSFCKNIGFRYCCYNQHKATAIVSYLRYKETNEQPSKPSEYFKENNLNCYSVNINAASLPTYTMKVISRRDSGQRHVFDLNVEEPYSNFLAQGAVVHNCNSLPDLRYSDKATWNRIRVIPFESTFVDVDEDYCPPTYDEQLREKKFPKDPNFSNKIPELLCAFAWYLLQYRLNNDGIQKSDPPKVKEATAMYRKQNDIYRQFVDENIKEDDTWISILEMYASFKDWFKEGFPGRPMPLKNEVKKYFEKQWGDPSKGGKWHGYRLKTLQDDMACGDVVVLEDDDLVVYDDDGDALPPE